MLAICTANQCRSPMAAALLQRLLLGAHPEVRVGSAGIRPGGHPATADARAVMADRGLDLSGHLSRQVDRALLAEADLVITMAREHVREVSVLEPAAFDRTFTLKEIARAAMAAGARRPSEDLAAWLARVRAPRRREALLGVGHDDEMDIADPVGRSRRTYESTADELERLLGALVDRAWPSHAVEQTA